MSERQIVQAMRRKEIIRPVGGKRGNDCTLTRRYGFTDEELDFIINYDIKYRMGQDVGGADE